MSKPLVIVESPAKAKTISKFLGKDFIVESSIGHIRDLPNSTDDLPEEFRGKPWSRMAINVDDDFQPIYVVSPQKKKQVALLRAALKQADELYLATDEDREGEAIAWHLLEVLKPKVPVKRMVFHEITEAAIQHAVENSRDLDTRLVEAQEGRRILDRLVGFELSPVLWRKINGGLSAGRVQSVALRLVVERERARIRFRTAEYWDLAATFDEVKGEKVTPFPATLVALDGKRLASGKDFGENGELTRPDAVLLDGDTARTMAEQLKTAPFAVKSVEQKPYRRSPYAPFQTSTLQQEAGRKLGFSSSRAMSAAQRLYEQGYITYMRTDSTNLSEQALNAARSQARSMYGAAYVPEAPRRYTKKSKGAQEAHEAIRPSGETFKTPDQVMAELGRTSDDTRLYELIWKRTIASQMADATGQSMSVRITARFGNEDQEAEFAASGRTITFPGYMRAYVEGADDPNAALEDRETHLPELAVSDSLAVADVDTEGNPGLAAKGHTTQPPARYTEASLVKAMEEMGIGRPSTYAATVNNILSKYCWKKGSAIVPMFVAFSVIRLLEEQFPTYVDYGFTAEMENELDSIANGSQEKIPWLRAFYYGNGKPGLKQMVADDRLVQIDPRELNTIPLGEDANGEPIIVRVSFGRAIVQRGDESAPVPEGVAPDEITLEKAEELFNTSQERDLGVEPESGLTVWAKAGRFGPYVQVGELDTENKKAEKPRTASLFRSMSLDTITLDQAMQLLSLPRIVGVDPETGTPIEALNGRYGPYLKKGTDSRSLETEEQLFAVTLEEALAIYAQPKTRRGQTVKPPLKEMGLDPTTEKPIVVKEGRFGPYCTDGETNASLRAGDTVEELTLERAIELLADRRAAGPKKKPAKKVAAKKTAAKKTTAKKTTAKKTVAKKPESLTKKTVAAKTGAAKKAAVKKIPTPKKAD